MTIQCWHFRNFDVWLSKDSKRCCGYRILQNINIQMGWPEHVLLSSAGVSSFILNAHGLSTVQLRYIIGLSWIPWKLLFRYIHCTGKFTPKMKGKAELHLLSSLVWFESFDFGVVVSQPRLEPFFMKYNVTEWQVCMEIMMKLWTFCTCICLLCGCTNILCWWRCTWKHSRTCFLLPCLSNYSITETVWNS